ncbi:MAG: WD40 repeat domain-containing protein [Chthonomonas sp.]|nr:WD40 repeat domain-containing protein [Chthonomonas sp.]
MHLYEKTMFIQAQFLRALAMVSLAMGAIGIVKAVSLPWDWQVPTNQQPLAVAFSADSQVLAVSSAGNAVRFLDPVTLGQIKSIPTSGYSERIAMSPNGATLATMQGNNVILHDVASCLPIRTLTGHTGAVKDVKISADGIHVVTAAADNSVRVWDLDSGVLLRTIAFAGTGTTVRRVEISPDGQTIMASSTTHQVKTFALATGDPGVLATTFTSPLNEFAFSPNGQLVAFAVAATSNKVHIYNASTGVLVRSHDAPGPTLVEFSPDSQNVSAITGGGILLRWLTSDGSELPSLFPVGPATPYDFAYAPNGQSFVVVHLDQGSVSRFDANALTQQSVTSGHTMNPADIDVSSTGLAATVETKFQLSFLNIWNAATGAHVRTMQPLGSNLVGTVFSPDGTRVLSLANSGGMDSFRVSDGVREWSSSSTGSFGSLSAAWQADGQFIFRGSADGYVVRHSAATGSAGGAVGGIGGATTDVVILPSGQGLLASRDDGKTWLLPIPLAVPTVIHTGPNQAIHDISISPSGTQFAAGAADGAIRMWNVGTAAVFKTITGHTDDVTAVNYAPSGYLISASYDGTIRYWNPKSGQQIAIIDGVVGSPTSMKLAADARHFYIAGNIAGRASNPIQMVSSELTLSQTSPTFATSRMINYTVKQGATTLASGSVSTSAPTLSVYIPLDAGLSGSVSVQFEGAHFLRKSVPLTLSGTDMSLGSVALANGDADDSGEVDAADIDQIISDFGDVWPGGIGNPWSDLDCNGEVDAGDIDLAIANFGQSDQ